MKPKILIVEDEPGIADIIRYALSTDGFEPLHCSTAAEALAAFSVERPALAVLDVGLPDMNGFELFKRLQALPGGAETPMLFLTARSDEIDRVVGLELGADDYIAKPFSPRELSARVRSILRRSGKVGASGGTNTVAVSASASVTSAHLTANNPFVVDDPRKRITYCGTVLELSRYEYGLLKTLLSHPGRVYSRDELLAHVWDDPGESLDRTVDAHIKTVRSKLKSVSPEQEPIHTHRGLGYSILE
jgi:two-component system, OmpR family, catabolic regulation response regulator CreB